MAETSPAVNEFGGETEVSEGSGECIKQIVAYGRPSWRPAPRPPLFCFSLTETNPSSIVPPRYNLDCSRNASILLAFLFYGLVSRLSPSESALLGEHRVLSGFSRSLVPEVLCLQHFQALLEVF